MNPWLIGGAIAALVLFFGRKKEVVVDTIGTGMEITYDETIDPRLLYSATAEKLGLDNEPTNETHRQNLIWLTGKIKELEGKTANVVSSWPITSGYRSAEVNTAVGGEAGSRHLSGLAIDVGLSDPQKAALFEAVIALDDPSLQQAIIYEWQNSLHFGFFAPGEATKAPSLLASYVKGSYEVFNG